MFFFDVRLLYLKSTTLEVDKTQVSDECMHIANAVYEKIWNTEPIEHMHNLRKHRTDKKKGLTKKYAEYARVLTCLDLYS